MSVGELGIELELGVLLAISIVGPAIFGHFERETPSWRRILKWSMIVAITLLLHRSVGHLALIVPLGMATVGMVVHFVWCARKGIDPVTARPLRRYYQLRGWPWPEDWT